MFKSSIMKFTSSKINIKILLKHQGNIPPFVTLYDLYIISNSFTAVFNARHLDGMLKPN